MHLNHALADAGVFAWRTSMTFQAFELSVVVVLAVIAVLAMALSSVRVIGESQSGLVVKRFGPPLSSSRIIALNGEAGYQARMLSPGWHFGLWRWKYKVKKVPVIVVQPGEIALVVAADGRPIPSERVLARAVACDNFQDAETFLNGGGERGRQVAFLTAGTYRINPALFEVVMPSTAKAHGMNPSDLHVYQMSPERVGIVTSRGMRAFRKVRRSSMPADVEACRRKCCCPVRGT
jgi:uncharacterized membrane protein YqiK